LALSRVPSTLMVPSNKNLSEEKIVEEVRKIRGLSKAILADIHKENAAKH